MTTTITKNKQKAQSISLDARRALQFYDRGMTIQEVALNLHITFSKAYKLLKDAGYTPRKAGPRTKCKLSHQEILELFNDGNGLSLTAIGERGGVSKQRIKQILKSQGVTLSSNSSIPVSA